MTREEFRIVPRFYTTSSLTMIFHREKIIFSVEVFKNYGFLDDAEDKKKRDAIIAKALKNGKLPKDFKVAPVKKKSTKTKRTEQEISKECEAKIAGYIKAHSELKVEENGISR